MTDTILGVVAGLNLVLIALVSLLYRAAVKRLSGQIEKLAHTVNEGLNAGPKMVEVSNFYDYASAEFQRLLNEAHREGNRQRQDRFRRLIERLGTLKARVLDQTAKLLGDREERPSRKRRRRPRRPKRDKGAEGSRQGNVPAGPS